jgi:hypothetical protein
MIKKIEFYLNIHNSIYSSNQILEMFKKYDIKIRHVYTKKTYYIIDANRDDEFNINTLLDDNKIFSKSIYASVYIRYIEEEEK